jgi:predicted transcriptional regulator
MGKAISYDQRKKIVIDYQSGKTYSEISEELGYSVNGVRNIWYAYQKQGELSFCTSYKNCGTISKYDSPVREAVKKIKTGEQGATFVYSMLKLKNPELNSPSVRTLQRWWKKGNTSRPKGRPKKYEKKIGLMRPTTLYK